METWQWVTCGFLLYVVIGTLALLKHVHDYGITDTGYNYVDIGIAALGIVSWPLWIWGLFRCERYPDE